MKLRDLRIAAGKDQKEIAEMLGVAVSTYSQYETGKTIPSLHVLRKLADYYNVSLDYLVDRTSEDYLHLSEEEKELIYFYNNVTKTSQASLLREARYLLGEEQYKKSSGTVDAGKFEEDLDDKELES